MTIKKKHRTTIVHIGYGEINEDLLDTVTHTQQIACAIEDVNENLLLEIAYECVPNWDYIYYYEMINEMEKDAMQIDNKDIVRSAKSRAINS